MTGNKTFVVGDEVEQLSRKFRLTDAGWKRVNPHTGGVSELTAFERKFFQSAANLAAAEDSRARAVEQALAERAMRRALEA